MPAYVNSIQTTFTKTDTDPVNQAVPFVAVGGANNLLVIGSFNKTGGAAGIVGVTDDGGNTWFQKSGGTPADPDFWYTVSHNPCTVITLQTQDTVTPTPWSDLYYVIVAEYSGFTSIGNITPNGGANNVATASLGDGVHPLMGFSMFYATDTGAATELSHIGTVRQQIYGNRFRILGTEPAGIALIDNFTDVSGISQTLTRSVFWITMQGFKNFSSIPTNGTVTVHKATQPGGSLQSFDFTPSWGSPFSLTDGQSNISGPLAPGTYSVSETPVAGWDTTTNIDPTSIVVTAGANTDVIFTNTQRGQINVSKVTNPTGDSQVFTFHPSWGSTFTLTDGLSNNSGLLVPGTYSITEDAVTNWVTTTNIDPSAIVLAAGQTVNLVFTNTYSPPPDGRVQLVGCFQDALGVPLSFGYLILKLSWDGKSGGGQIGAGKTTRVQLTSLGCAVPTFIWANDAITPSGSYYTIYAYSQYGQLVWGPQYITIPSSPTVFDIGEWVPNG